MKKTFALTLLSSLFLLGAGCAGRHAQPVVIHQYGDPYKSCSSLHLEMRTIESDVHRLIPQTNKTPKNIALGAAGWFLFVPWLFMDFTEPEKQEIKALERRYQYLALLSQEKKCEVDNQITLEESDKTLNPLPALAHPCCL